MARLLQQRADVGEDRGETPLVGILSGIKRELPLENPLGPQKCRECLVLGAIGFSASLLSVW